MVFSLGLKNSGRVNNRKGLVVRAPMDVIQISLFLLFLCFSFLFLFPYTFWVSSSIRTLLRYIMDSAEGRFDRRKR